MDWSFLSSEVAVRCTTFFFLRAVPLPPIRADLAWSAASFASLIGMMYLKEEDKKSGTTSISEDETACRQAEVYHDARNPTYIAKAHGQWLLQLVDEDSCIKIVLLLFSFETMRVLAPFHFQHTLHHTATAKPTPTQPHTACQSGFCVH